MAEEESKKMAALAELKAAVQQVRTLAATEDQAGDAMKIAKKQIAIAMQAAMKAGIPQEAIVAASKAPAETKDEQTEGADEEKKESPPPKKREPRKPSARKVAMKAAREAAEAAREAGKAAPEIAKGAAAAAKAAGGDASDISEAAKMAVKIAAGESLPPIEEGDDGDDSSSSSSDSSSSVEDEVPLEEKDRAKAKREGIAAAFYFGIKK